MSEERSFLKSIQIKNYRNLRDVKLLLKPLTIIVGPNASGKSNILNALYFVQSIIGKGINPLSRTIQESFWAREVNNFSFDLQTQVKDTNTEYELVVKRNSDKYLFSETLLVNNRKIISIDDCQGTVEGETDRSKTEYNSDVPALEALGKFGNRPITRLLCEFIKEWQFQDLDPDFVKGSLRMFHPVEDEIQKDLKLSIYGGNLPNILWKWRNDYNQDFINLVDSFYDIMNFRIDYETIDGDDKFSLIEKGKNSLPLEVASDGTLRLIAYLMLRNELEPPSLIAFEEPERSFHPGLLSEIATILSEISENSQVIITTHSSELLNAFLYSDFTADSLSILLLRTNAELGTEVINVNEKRRNNEDLAAWMADFGIGSAIFDSPFLQAALEDQE